MKTLKVVPVEPVFVEQYIPENEQLEEGKIYISREFSTAVHKCLCGCGAIVVTPLIPSMWQLTENNGKISLTPSIGNFQQPCNTHYIITNNKANFV